MPSGPGEVFFCKTNAVVDVSGGKRPIAERDRAEFLQGPSLKSVEANRFVRKKLTSNVC